jgi:subtilisin
VPRGLAPAVAIAVLALAVPLAGTAAAQPRVDTDIVPGSFIVVYEDSVSSVDEATDARERRGGFRSAFRYRSALKGFSARLSERQVADLAADPQVASITPNRRMHAFGALLGGESAPMGIQRINASASQAGGWANEASSVGVAVIDTGIALDHPDLDQTASDGTNCIAPGAAAHDDNGHGTHVAGTIAAENDGSGAIGVAPGTRVYAVKVLDAAGSGTWDQILCGIDWVTANAEAKHIRVANMSLGGLGTAADNQPCGSGATTALHEAVCRSTAAGVRYAVAAGNDGWAFPHSTLPDVPAAYPEVVTVTASSDGDGRPGGFGSRPGCRTGEWDEATASFSNFSDNSADDNAHTVAAPGVCIRSTWLDGGHSTISGTSMAAPHVAGAVALCIGQAGAGPGPCAGLTAPSQLIASVSHSEPGHGFCGAPNVQPVSGRFYGYETLAGATPASPSFAICPAPRNRTVQRGRSTSFSLALPRSAGFADPLTLSVSGLPSNAIAAFSPSAVSLSSSTMTVTARSSTPRGTYTLSVKGTSAAGPSAATQVTLTVR